MSNRSRRRSSNTSKATTQSRSNVRASSKVPSRPAPKSTGSGSKGPAPSGPNKFGAGTSTQENHVHVPQELMPDIYGNEFMKTMLA